MAMKHDDDVQDIDEELTQELEATCRRLWPSIPAERVPEAAQNIGRYIRLTLRVFDRIRQDPEQWAKLEAWSRREQIGRLKRGR
jgi:hypothetical protein